MNDLLTKESRESLENTMTKYFLVDSIRSDYGDLNKSLDHIEDVAELLKSRESSVRTRVHQMTDEQLMHELFRARTSPSSDKSQR